MFIHQILMLSTKRTKGQGITTPPSNIIFPLNCPQICCTYRNCDRFPYI